MTTTPEPRRYAWMRDGELVAGTLQQWAHMWEGDYYSGDNDLSRDLLHWDGKTEPVIWPVNVLRDHPGENDYIPYRIHCHGETVYISIDGRA